MGRDTNGELLRYWYRTSTRRMAPPSAIQKRKEVIDARLRTAVEKSAHGRDALPLSCTQGERC